MKNLTLIILAVLFSFDVQAQNLESINGGIIFISNQNTALNYDGRIPGLETGLTYLLVPAKIEYGIEVIAESNLRYWTEAVKSDQYTQKYVCNHPCYANEQSAISLTTEIGLRNRITIFRDFFISVLTGLNYEMRLFNDPDFPNHPREAEPHREFNIGVLAKAKFSSFLTNRTKLHLSWQSAFYEFNGNDLPNWSMPAFSAGLSYSLN